MGLYLWEAEVPWISRFEGYLLAGVTKERGHFSSVTKVRDKGLFWVPRSTRKVAEARASGFQVGHQVWPEVSKP